MGVEETGESLGGALDAGPSQDYQISRHHSGRLDKKPGGEPITPISRVRPEKCEAVFR